MIKLSDLLSESVVAKDGMVKSNGKLIGYYDFDRDSDSFWVDDVKVGRGQLSFDTKKEVENYYKKNEKLALKYLDKMRESVNEATDFKVYHKSYTEAIQTAKEYALKKGYMVDEDDSFRKIGMGPRKPSEGKTVKVSVELTKGGKPSNKQLHIQVYGMKNGYELNCYIG